MFKKLFTLSALSFYTWLIFGKKQTKAGTLPGFSPALLCVCYLTTHVVILGTENETADENAIHASIHLKMLFFKFLKTGFADGNFFASLSYLSLSSAFPVAPSPSQKVCGNSERNTLREDALYQYHRLCLFFMSKWNIHCKKIKILSTSPYVCFSQIINRKLAPVLLIICQWILIGFDTNKVSTGFTLQNSSGFQTHQLAAAAIIECTLQFYFIMEGFILNRNEKTQTVITSYFKFILNFKEYQ